MVRFQHNWFTHHHNRPRQEQLTTLQCTNTHPQREISTRSTQTSTNASVTRMDDPASRGMEGTSSNEETDQLTSADYTGTTIMAISLELVKMSPESLLSGIKS
ncbi:TPA: hypothetical protein IW770_002733 [Enterococcus faecium]|nr:hypothetical protein [Enterococcus faecium]